MNTDFPTEETIRQYLLGKLDSRLELESGLSHQMFVNAELSETVDMIEDEIVEEYLDGRFNPADKKAIEEYFLRPSQRKEKLELARLLREHFQPKQFQTEAGRVAKKKLAGECVTAAEPFVDRSPLFLHWRSHGRTYCELAACFLLIAVGAFYLYRVNLGWRWQLDASQTAQTKLEGDLARERERSANLSRQLQQLHPSTVTLSFLGAMFRDPSAGHEIEIKPWTQQIKVEIGLPTAAPGNYSVLLETKAGKEIWSKESVVGAAGALRFDIPAERISTTGSYCLVVSSRPEPYCFVARVSSN